MLAVTRRRLAQAERQFLEDVVVAMTVADPRIWPLKLVRVVSSYTNDLAAFAAGQLCQAGAPIGLHSINRAANLLLEVRRDLGERCDDAEAVSAYVRALLVRNKRLPGLGVPFRPVDERVTLLIACTQARARANLPNFRVFLQIQAVLEALGGPLPNAALPLSAICLDLGLESGQCGIFAAALCSIDFVANAVEGAAQAPGALRELPLRAIANRGREPRATPRALAKRRPGE
jgi:hypothetical protein